VAHQSGFHYAGLLVSGFSIKKVCFSFRPPTKSVARLTKLKFRKDLNPDHHVQKKDFLIVEKILTPRPPKPKVPSKPPPRIAVYVHPFRDWRLSVRWL
jgi:hypothetical protein